MKKRTAKENLKSFSWIYIIVAAFYLVGAIICFAMPELRDKVKEAFASNDLDGLLVYGCTTVVVILFNIWYFWLCRRVADKKSNGTLYIVLLILGVVGSIVSIFTTKGAGSALGFDAIVDILGLYYVYQFKKTVK